MCTESTCTIFTLLYLSPHSPSSHWYQYPRHDLFCHTVLRFCKRKWPLVCLSYLYGEFLCDISKYTCIIT
jgi:hypothetical protein